MRLGEVKAERLSTTLRDTPLLQGLKPRFLWINSIRISWRIVRDANSWALPTHTASESLGIGPNNLNFNQPARWFWCFIQFENRWFKHFTSGTSLGAQWLRLHLQWRVRPLLREVPHTVQCGMAKNIKMSSENINRSCLVSSTLGSTQGNRVIGRAPPQPLL